jgi:DNA-binding NarL/FixJ family response regulator
MSIIKYAIADDHKIFRQGLRFALGDDHKLKLVGEAENGVMLLQLIEKQKPEVVLIDLKMPEMDGVEVTKQIRLLYPDIKILILTMFEEEHFIMHLMEIGANGYLLKNTEPEEIKKAIHAVFENDFYFNDLVSNTMLRNIVQKKNIATRFKKEIKLNDKEIEILKLICKELTAAEIAREVFLSQRRVEGIRSELLEKIGVRNTAGLVLYAVKNGLVK